MSLTAIKLLFGGIPSMVKAFGFFIILVPLACLFLVIKAYLNQADKLITCRAATNEQIRLVATKERELDRKDKEIEKQNDRILDLRLQSEEEHAERLWIMDNLQDQRIKNETLSERIRKESQRSREGVVCNNEPLPNPSLLPKALEAANTAH